MLYCMYMNFTPVYKITNTLAKELLEIERHKEALNVLPVTANLIASLRETARLLSTHYSTQIEGNELSHAEVEEIAQGKKGGFPGRERDEREVRNYFRALEYVEIQLREKKDLTENLVKRIHSLVLVGTSKETPYREGQNVIRDGRSGRIVYMPPESKDVAPMMNEMIDWLNMEMKKKELPAPIIAGLAHYQFATIHPYYDGNGRTARLLTTFLLHKMGYGMKGIYSLEEYYAKNLSGYYEALNIGKSHNYYEGRAKADITPFLEYFLGGMGISFKRVRQQAELGKKQNLPLEDQANWLRELRPQQRQVLSLLQKSKEITTQEIADHMGVSKRSAHDLVKKWIEKDFIEIINHSNRARTYGLTKEWELVILNRINQRIQKIDDTDRDGKYPKLSMKRKR